MNANTGWLNAICCCNHIYWNIVQACEFALHSHNRWAAYNSRTSLLRTLHHVMQLILNTFGYCLECIRWFNHCIIHCLWRVPGFFCSQIFQSRRTVKTHKMARSHLKCRWAREHTKKGALHRSNSHSFGTWLLQKHSERSKKRLWELVNEGNLQSKLIRTSKNFFSFKSGLHMVKTKRQLLT